jgi:hypothetical protein
VLYFTVQKRVKTEEKSIAVHLLDQVTQDLTASVEAVVEAVVVKIIEQSLLSLVVMEDADHVIYIGAEMKEEL